MSRENKYEKGSLSKKTLPVFLSLKKIIHSLMPCVSWYDENKILCLTFEGFLNKAQLAELIKKKYDFSIDDEGYIIVNCLINEK